MPGKGKASGWEAFRDRAGIVETTMIPGETHRAGLHLVPKTPS